MLQNPRLPYKTSRRGVPLSFGLPTLTFGYLSPGGCSDRYDCKPGDVYQKFECDGEMLKITGYDAMGCSVAAPTAETIPAQGSYARDSCVASAMKISFTTCTTSGGGTGDASAAAGVYSHAVLVALQPVSQTLRGQLLR